MDEQDQSDASPPPIPPTITDLVPPARPPPKPFSYWVKHLFACNPFYLLSAALLLFGCYQISLDKKFLSDEPAQLIFNFSSLQFYELLVVATAIFLARRRIWYDSTLLAGLESLLLFVPFIFISQAALIDAQLVRVMCLGGAAFALLRFGCLKRFFTELNLPRRVLVIGAVLLAVNVILPLVYRILHDAKVGIGPTQGYQMNEWTWLLILPAALALANFLPYAREAGSFLPQRRWLPAGWFALWIAGTAVHFYCLQYVYNFHLRRELLAPALWVLAWTAFLRLPDLFTSPKPAWSKILIVPPVAAALFAASYENKVFLVLTFLNAVIFAVWCFRQRNLLLVRHLLFTSAVMLVAGAPIEWIRWVIPEFDRDKCVGAAGFGYLILCTVFSRNPKLGILGSIILAVAITSGVAEKTSAVHWALQGSLAFLLLHSLRWEDMQHQGAGAVRIMTGVLWVAHSLFWTHNGGPSLALYSTGLAVLGGYFAARLLRGRWDPIVLPITSTLVLLSGPGYTSVEKLHSTSSGLLAVIGSFVLFALGTAAALTRHRWHQPGRIETK